MLLAALCTRSAVKYLVFLMLLISSVASSKTLTTDNFVIEIAHDCEEGEVTCDAIKFVYSPAGFKQKHTVIGKTVHRRCADGITPCAFQGYEFQSDGATYFIRQSGVLVVTDNRGNQLLVEQGSWEY